MGTRRARLVGETREDLSRHLGLWKGRRPIVRAIVALWWAGWSYSEIGASVGLTAHRVAQVIGRHLRNLDRLPPRLPEKTDSILRLVICEDPLVTHELCIPGTLVMTSAVRSVLHRAGFDITRPISVGATSGGERLFEQIRSPATAPKLDPGP